MQMNDSQRIPAPKEKVWAALNDPEVLKSCIPGSEQLDKISDHEFQAIATVKVGPVKARWKGKVRLSDLDPPNSYRISGEGEGGVAGFAKGGACRSHAALAVRLRLSFARAALKEPIPAFPKGLESADGPRYGRRLR